MLRYIAKYILDGMQNKCSPLDMLPFLILTMLANLLLALLNGLYQGSYFPRKKEILEDNFCEANDTLIKTIQRYG